MKRLILNYLIIAVIAVSAIFTSCNKDDDDSKKSNFSSPEEFLKNPSVSKAIKESNIDINKGDKPPTLEGTYLTNGKTTNASELLASSVNIPFQSEFKLYNQTSSGKINLQEKVAGLTASGIGCYITGDNGKFTIYAETKQDGKNFGLPNNSTATVALLMSGTKLSNGNLRVKGVSTFTEVSHKEPYNLEGSWWIWEADFNLQSGTKSIELSLEDGALGCLFVPPTKLTHNIRSEVVGD